MDNVDAQTKRVWQKARWKESPHEGPPIYLFVRDGRIDFPQVVDAEFVNAADHIESVKSHPDAPIPPIVEVCCPRCGERSLIKHGKKTIRIQGRTPKRFKHPHDGRPCVQTFRLTIDEVLTCAQPGKSGKGVCGYRFRITDNVLHGA